MTEIKTSISTRDIDPHFYMCGRLIEMNKSVVTPIFSLVLSRAWNLKEKLLVREEESGRFVFQFKLKAERDRIAGEGSWSFNGGMLILTEYEGLSPVEDVSLNHLEVWISIAGLRFSMRNNMVFSRVANCMGVFVRVDSAVKLEFKVERAHGICKDCGFFGHGGGICDKGLINGLPVVEAVNTVDGEAELLASRSTKVGGLVKEPTGLEDGLRGSEEAAALVVSSPNISTGNPSFQLGLTEPMRLTEDVGPGDSRLKRKFGFGFSGDGPARTDLVLKKPKSSFHSEELVKVPVRFGTSSEKVSQEERSSAWQS
ncbi:hypothetical protein ACLB2K_041166 [Fragaria x ananassa]